MYFLRIIICIILLGTAPTVATAETPAVKLYRFGQSLTFSVLDIDRIQLERRSDGNGNQLVIKITETMSERFKSFLSEMIGKRLTSVFDGRVQQSGAVVHEVITGRLIHISGGNQDSFHRIKNRFRVMKMKADMSGEIVMSLHENKGEFALIPRLGGNNETVDMSVKNPNLSDLSEPFGLVLTSDMKNWRLTICSSIIDNWNLNKDDGQITLSGVPSQVITMLQADHLCPSTVHQ